jgi:hypothetical protein
MCGCDLLRVHERLGESARPGTFSVRDVLLGFEGFEAEEEAAD